ncbi:MAG: P-loop NTPase fold protein [Candidatus Delongbacteria bacterium]|jgi:hypothetical protein|nr:P-loop NTPase fold protein [Candidatus Delongbacteria bacterium]
MSNWETLKFNSVYDKLKRKEVATYLSEIILSRKDSFVLSVDSSWGTGKSWFIKMWINEIFDNTEYKQEIYPVYFNAWKNDDFNDPLLAIISTICKKEKENPLYKNVETNVKPLLKKGLKFLLKKATHGAIDDEFFELISSGFSLESDDEIFKEYEDYKEKKEKFREALLKFQSDETNGIKKKIVVFIDELDRCRPSFAIETLEKIKHLFNIENYIFVLSVDKEQLSHSIATLYGQNMDSIGYLRRFIDLECRLPQSDIKNYYLQLKEQYIKNNNINANWAFFFTILEDYIRIFDFSLRDINKLFNLLEIVLPSIFKYHQTDTFNAVQEYSAMVSSLISYFICLKFKAPDLYKIVKNNDFVISDFNSIRVKLKLNYPLSTATYLKGKNSKILEDFIKIRYDIQNNNIRTTTIQIEYKVGAEKKVKDLDISSMFSYKSYKFKFFEQIEFVESYFT